MPNLSEQAVSERLSDLLLRWQEGREQGSDLAAGELCTDCPELEDELRSRMKAIVAMEAFLAAPDPVAGSMGNSQDGNISAAVRIPGYEILAILGRGGMGVVYKAYQSQLRRTVAVKMISAGARAVPEQLHRFRTEVEAAARLHHPNI